MRMVFLISSGFEAIEWGRSESTDKSRSQLNSIKFRDVTTSLEHCSVEPKMPLWLIGYKKPTELLYTTEFIGDLQPGVFIQKTVLWDGIHRGIFHGSVGAVGWYLLQPQQTDCR